MSGIPKNTNILMDTAEQYKKDREDEYNRVLQKAIEYQQKQEHIRQLELMRKSSMREITMDRYFNSEWPDDSPPKPVVPKTIEVIEDRNLDPI